MGASSHLAIPDSSQKPPSLSSLPHSPSSCLFSPSLSSSDSSCLSFSQSLPRGPHDGVPAPYILKHAGEDHRQQRQQSCTAFERTVRQKNPAKLNQFVKSSSPEPLGKCKFTCTKGVSMRKSCYRSAGAFAADCAAVSCCPCAVFSLLFMVLIELPSSLARKVVTRLQKRTNMKDEMSSRSCNREEESSNSIVTTSWSCEEASKQEPAASIIQFSTQSLLEHFKAEHVGFGCLSQERE